MYITITAQQVGGDYAQSATAFVDYLEKENEGKPMADPMAFSPDTNYEDHEFMRSALRRDMVAICEECTAIYMMAEWEKSRGAKAEWHLAKALGLDIYYEVPLPIYPE